MRSSTALAPVLVAGASTVRVTISSSGGNATSPWQYELMLEIYPKNLNYRNALGAAELSLQDLLANPLSDELPPSIQVAISPDREDVVGFSNEGFWDFPVVKGWQYNHSFYALGGLNGNLTIFLVSNANEVFVETTVAVSSSDAGTKYGYSFIPGRSAPDSNNTLNFTFAASDLDKQVNFNFLSLFPATYNDRPNGNRIDLMEAMDRLNPSFFRMPGGNNFEGFHPPYWWNWTNSVGSLEKRPGFPGFWAYEQTNGLDAEFDLGILEYLLWAQDLNMEPVLAVFASLWLEEQTVPRSNFQPYIYSALDKLEFLTGDTSTPWGARRGKFGYGPFEINYVEIGNEDSLKNGTQTYEAYRFDMVIREAYPNIIIGSYYDVNGTKPPYDAWEDFHDYADPVQMSSQFDYFDNDTTTVEHPVLIGEYVVVGYDRPGVRIRDWKTTRSALPLWHGSVAEAIFLLGAERNGHTTFSTSYYVSEILSRIRPTENLRMTITDVGFGPAYFVAGRNDDTGAHIAKFAVYNSSSNVPFDLAFDGVGAGAVGNLRYITAPMNASNAVGNDVIESVKHGTGRRRQQIPL